MKSVRGIYYDLKDSDFIFSYGNLKLVFSSQFYLNKFKVVYEEYLKNETLKLNSKYKCRIYCTTMLLLSLYKSIEKRGFRVLIDDKELTSDYKLYVTI